MSTLPRPCLGAINPNTRLRETCGVPTPNTRCPRHAAMMSPSRRGYDKQYQRDRAEMLALRPRCELRLPGCTTWATTADHTIPLELGGPIRQILVPACLHCNGKKGAR